MAFMAFVLAERGGAGRSGGTTTGVAKLPYGGINRIRFEGSVSTAALRYPRFGRH
jgi:hypothetical protein